MKCLKRNQTSLHYALYKGKEQITDEDGNLTGEYKVLYSDPVEMQANVSAASGASQVEQFGNSIQYDKVIVTDDISCPIDENTVHVSYTQLTLPTRTGGYRCCRCRIQNRSV